MKLSINEKEMYRLLKLKGTTCKLIIVIQMLAKYGVIHYQTIRKLTLMTNPQIDEAIEQLTKSGLLKDDGIEHHFKHLHFSFVKD